MYKEGGRPPVSPKLLLLVLLMQFIERLSDRTAAYNLRYRLDWKIAFGLELDFAGIHPTTLVYFRDRLVENEKASYAFDQIIGHLVECGLIKKNTKQRIDSTHIIGKVRELSRLELFHETLRVFCNEIEVNQITIPQSLVERYEFYLEDISIKGISEAQKTRYIREAGLSMKLFIDWGIVEDSEEVSTLKSYNLMIQVFEQNFVDDNPDPDGKQELIKVATGKDHICSPHEDEARYANKGGKGWIGYKGQIAETISEGDVNFITHIELDEATDHDEAAIDRFVDDQKEKGILPSKVYGDTHYNTSDNIEKLEKDNIELVGPVMPRSQKEVQEKNKGFRIDADNQAVTCPANKTSKRYSIRSQGQVSATFSLDDCDNCPRKKICQPEPRGKTILLRPENETLELRRAMMETEEFKEDMHKRNGIEGTISGLVRGQGLRLSRYRGKAKNRLQLKLGGAAANVSRLHRKRCADRENVRKQAA